MSSRNFGTRRMVGVPGGMKDRPSLASTSPPQTSSLGSQSSKWLFMATSEDLSENTKKLCSHCLLDSYFLPGKVLVLDGVSVRVLREIELARRGACVHQEEHREDGWVAGQVGG